MRGSSRRIVLAACAVLLTATSGCGPGEDEQPATLPPVTPSTTAPTSPSPVPTRTEGLSDKAQVRTVYTEFLIHHLDAQDQPKESRRKFLSQWMIDPALRTHLEDFNRQQKDHQRTSGQYKSNIIEIRVKRDDATVEDCIDQRSYKLRDSRTGRTLAVDSEDDFFWGVTTLRRVRDGWRVDQTGYKDETCTAP